MAELRIVLEVDDADPTLDDPRDVADRLLDLDRNYGEEHRGVLLSAGWS